MPYGNGCKVQFSLPEQEAALLRKYARSKGYSSESLAAKELLLAILNRPSLLKSGELDPVAIREKLTALEAQSAQTAQLLKKFGDEQKMLLRDWESLTKVIDNIPERQLRIDGFLNAIWEAITSIPTPPPRR